MSPNRLRIGAWLVDPALDEIRRGDELIKLEPRAMRVLLYLAQRPGAVISADELLDAVWPGLVVGQNSVYQAIALLRRELGDDSGAPAYIATVPRKGYRLIAEVGAAEEIAAPAASALASTPEPQPSLPSADIPPPRSRRRWTSLGAAAAVLVVIGVLIFWQQQRAAALPGTPASVVVLPFEDLSPTKDNQAFCDGLTEELINSLGRLHDLRVTARTSAFAFRGRDTDARNIGRELGVTHLVEGSVRREGQRIRISAHLINVSTGYQEWAESFDRPFDDLLEIQSGISQAVARVLEVRLAQATPPGAVPRASAYELYLLGRFQQLRRSPESIARAMEFYRAALAQDPSFALAHAGLANSYMMGYWYANYRLEDAVAGVRENVARALAANPETAEAYVARGRMFLETYDLAAAQQDFTRAVTLNASLSDAYIGLAMVHEYRGEPRLALEPLDRAASLDPLHVALHGRRCLALQTLARFTEAESACRRMIELQPEFANGYWGLGLNAFAQGRTDDAIRGYTEALQRSPERIDLRAQLALLYLDRNRIDEAHAIYPNVAPDHPDYTAIGLERARWFIARQDTPGLAAQLDKLPLATVDGTDELLAAAAMELAAGRVAVAQALVERARSDPAFSVVKRIEQSWPGRWGRNDGITLAEVALAAGDSPSAKTYLDMTLAWLDRLEKNGHRSHGASYVRAAALALRDRPDEALQALRLAQQQGWRSAWWTRADPAFRAMRNRADFQALLASADHAVGAEPHLVRHLVVRDELQARGAGGVGDQPQR